MTIVEGDVLDRPSLVGGIQRQDVVYADLAGAIAEEACGFVDAMKAAGLKRLIFISSKGIYGEVPGEGYRSVLDPYRDSAAVIEVSGLDCTILRPGWFTHDDAIDYRITLKGEPFLGQDVSLNSVSDLIVKIALADDGGAIQPRSQQSVRAASLDVPLEALETGLPHWSFGTIDQSSSMAAS